MMKAAGSCVFVWTGRGDSLHELSSRVGVLAWHQGQRRELPVVRRGALLPGHDGCLENGAVRAVPQRPVSLPSGAVLDRRGGGVLSVRRGVHLPAGLHHGLRHEVLPWHVQWSGERGLLAVHGGIHVQCVRMH